MWRQSVTSANRSGFGAISPRDRFERPVPPDVDCSMWAA
jgi:hypothetical protein